MTCKFLRLAVVLGLLSAIGPFAIDMYLPALPAIGRGLGADVAGVQASLMSFFLALAVSQLAYGPAADLYGRKAPLYVGLVLFIVGSIGCALAPDIHTLVVFRFIAGLGGGAVGVIPRAIVRDRYTGAEAARLMSLLMLVFSVSPILAPLAGSLLIDVAGWRSVFWATGAIGVVGLAMVAFLIEETRAAEERARTSLAGTVAAFGELLRDRHFMGLVLIGAFGISSFFLFLANSSFVMIEHYHLTPRQYSLAFSVNAVSFFAVAQLTGRLTTRYGLVRVVKGAVMGFASVLTLLPVLFALGVDHLAVLMALMFVGFGFLGLVIPTTSVLALDNHGAVAGTASALMGTVQMLVGAALMAVGGLFFDGTAFPMVMGIAGCAWITLAFTLVTLSGPQPPSSAKEATGP